MAQLTTRDGVRLYYEHHLPSGDGSDRGGRPTVIFSCAYCTTHENWRGQVAPLGGEQERAAHREVLVVGAGEPGALRVGGPLGADLAGRPTKQDRRRLDALRKGQQHGGRGQ